MPILPFVQKIECIETMTFTLVTLNIKSRSPKANDLMMVIFCARLVNIWLLARNRVPSMYIYMTLMTLKIDQGHKNLTNHQFSPIDVSVPV